MHVKKKKVTEIEIFKDGEPLCYQGRLLGCISESEYLATINSTELQNKMLTVETTSCASLVDIPEIEGLRIVLSVKKKNDKKVDGKTLFITEPIDFLSSMLNKQDITLVGKQGSYIVVTESDMEV